MNRTRTFRQLTLAIMLTIACFTAARAGELSAPQSHLLGSHAEDPSLAVADFNRDGKLDVVKAGVDLDLAFGNGTGGFTNSPNDLFGGYHPRNILAPDLNADGNADLVMISTEHSNYEGTHLCVMLGNGNGTFQHRQMINLGHALGARVMMIADLDNDGRRDDLVFTGYDTQIVTMIGKNDGTFNPSTRSSSTIRGSIPSAIGDFNSDGKVDIVIPHEINGGSQPRLALGNGDGTFGSAEYIDFDFYGYEFPVAGDFNSDGKADFATVFDYGGQSALIIFIGRGDGTFEKTTLLALTGFDHYHFSSMRAAEMDGDGRLDLILTTAVTIEDRGVNSGYSDVAVLTNNASGWTHKIYPTNTNDVIGAIAVRDLTSDGKNDVLYATVDFPTFSHRIHFMKNNISQTTTALTSTDADNTTTEGDPVTFSAAITTASTRTFGKPAGAITFKLNGTPLCAMFPNANGGGTCGTAQLPVGSNQITVTFDGDPGFSASNSNTITHTVNARPQVPTTTALTSNDADNRTNFGEAVIFTVRVTANNGGTPTGSVVFKNNGTPLCAKPITNGAANCGTTELTVGSHNMTVEYQGGSGFGASNSGILVHTVTQTFTLTAIADAYVKGATADANYGAVAELQVKRTLNPGSGKGRQAYLRFDTSSVTGTITSAKLRVFARNNAVNTNIPLGVFAVSNSTWTEVGLTWNNKPAPNAPSTLSQVTVTDTTARWYELDITSFVQQERNAGRAITGILLRNMTAGANGDYYTAINSREATANQPQLVIVK